jgi:PKD repeat protein
MAIALIAAAAIAIILLAANVTLANAQQQQSTSQNSAIERGATTSRSTRDSFRVQVPQGWVIHDVKNSGSALVAEALDGVGILAQLCPEEEQQQVAFRNPGGNTSNSSISINSDRCQGAQVIHVIRYPNLGARLGLTSDDIFAIINRDTIPNAILTYQIQKLQEAGYRNIQIVNSTDTAINVDISTGLNNNNNNNNNNAIAAGTAATTTTTTTIVPAKLVAMTYSTNLAPNETRIGYFILTATAATPRNLGMITGYSVFYEGNSVVETVSSGSSVAPPPTPFPAAARQVFGSFELIAAAPAEPLRVEITSSDTEGVAPATFDFEANVTGGMEPYTIRWDFDDGDSDEEESDDDDNDVDHTFDVAGNYTVSATVTDSTGRTVSDSILITVEPAPPLTAVEITSSDTEGVAPATFDFEANVTGGTVPYTYSWDFGDGSVESDDDDESIDHTFDVAGNYTVTLTVTDSTGRTVSDSILITVHEREPPATEERMCDPSYPGLCIPPPPPDLDCDNISARNFRVLPPDPHRFDDDNDGIGCPTGINQPNLDNNSGSDNLFDLDDFLDDLFDRLGLR